VDEVTDRLRMAVPDLVSNSYFPALAALELGLFEREGLAVELELIAPVSAAAEALRDGRIDLLAGDGHAPLFAFPDWRGSRLLAALAQRTYWFLVLRADLPGERGQGECVRGRRIAAAPGPEMAFRRLLIEAGLDEQRDQITLGPIPAAPDHGVSFGVVAAKALRERLIDGFWANGLGAAVAVADGAGKVILDVRRGDGPPAAGRFTFPALACRADVLDQQPEQAAAVVRAIVAAQHALRAQPHLAAEVASRHFPPLETSLIESVVRADLPYYDSAISESTFADLNRFTHSAGLLDVAPPYESVVATQLAPLWRPD
jgi:ABC-type nitrate/sulfonate/bicarbonate transport system substrate-binding protein